MLEIYRWFVCHVDLLVKVEEIVTPKIFADGEEEALVGGEVAVARKSVGFAAEKGLERPRGILAVNSRNRQAIE